MARVAAVALVLLLLIALGLQSHAIRLFDHKHPLKREVGRRRRGRDGRYVRKEVAADSLGRAHFDPAYAHEDELTHEDLGLEDLHDPTDTVIENRLRQLFPAMDANHDGTVSLEELQRHIFQNAVAASRRRADAEFADTDANKDGKVTAAEYLANLLEEADEKTKKAAASGAFPDPLDYGSYTDSTRAAFVYADLDHDGSLSKAEFYDFMNPEEGTNVNLKLHRLRQDFFDHLTDHLNNHHPTELAMTLDQFFTHFWSQFTVWETHVNEEDWSDTRERANAQRKFILLDTNSDQLVTPEELLPAYAELHPTENRYARMQAEHMMDMADCKNDQLTLEQMLAVPHAFYGVVHDDGDHTEL